MQATSLGPNRTGAAINPSDVDLMIDAVNDLSPQIPINTAGIEVERLKSISEADSVGSIPPPASMTKGAIKKGVSKLNGISPSLLMDKIGERIGFERTGTRLYEALISKYMALAQHGEGEIPAQGMVLPDGARGSGALAAAARGGPLQALHRIRDEEQGHFQMLCEVMVQLGGDPTAQTPCADVAATASMGVLQVVTDPRTTLAQCLNAALIAELTDNASWELLTELAEQAGQDRLVAQFQEALAAEEQHLAFVRSWLRALTVGAAGTTAV